MFSGFGEAVKLGEALFTCKRGKNKGKAQNTHKRRIGNPVERQNSASQYVFTYKGKRVKNIKKAFQTALKNAGITDFRFHDLRHTFASQVIMWGGDLKEVQELLGHKTMSMTLRYSHLSQEHKKRAVNLLNGLTASARNRHEVINDADSRDSELRKSL